MDSQWLTENHRMNWMSLRVLSLLIGYFVDYTHLDLVVWFRFHSIHRFSLFIWGETQRNKTPFLPQHTKVAYCW